jgi:glycosyltransferase involved in cell wall biosynthesis
MSRPLRVLGHFHNYPPKHNAGAEHMAHAMLAHLAAVHGMECKVITARPPRRKDVLDGVGVEMIRNQDRARSFYQWADVAVTHLDVTKQAMRAAAQTDTPLVHLIHNDRQLTFHNVRTGRCDLAVWNSRWIEQAARDEGYDVEGIVVYPPVWVDRYSLGEITRPDVNTVALLNCTEAKGAPMLFELARRMPDVRFLAVRGAYGTQLDPPAGLDNVHVARNQPDVRRVYRQATVVVMPSTYESWGRVAVEAGAAGRPCVVANTPGLLETGIGAAELDPHDSDGWHAAVLDLLGPGWRTAAYRAHGRAVELERTSIDQMAKLAIALEALAP